MTGGAGCSHWPRAVVFDCDGLLVDTRRHWEGAFDDVLARNGRDPTTELTAAVGGSVRTAAADLSALTGCCVDAPALADALRARVDRGALAPRPGAHKIVALTGARWPVAVASNAPGPVLHVVLARVGLLRSFAAIVSADDVAREKPAPDAYEEACRRLGVHPSDAVAFEDSAAGSAAARAAGLFTVVVPDGNPGVDGDLVVPRLDDHRVLELLGLAQEVDSRIVCRRSLEALMRSVLDLAHDENVATADLESLAREIDHLLAVERARWGMAAHT